MDHLRKKHRYLAIPVVFIIAVLLLILFFGPGRYWHSDYGLKYDYPSFSVDKCRDCNVILISIDTLRPDHLGCYGYGFDTSPNIDDFSRDSILFKQSIAQAPSTTPSHASIFTSAIPAHHGAFKSKNTSIHEDVITITEILSENKYKCASFNGGGQLSEVYGFDRGFETYESEPIPFEMVFQKARMWVENNSGEKFFLFLHTFEVHHPYTPEKGYLEQFDKGYAGGFPDNISISLLRGINNGSIPIGEADKRHIIAAYDAEILSMDSSFGRLLDFLRSEGLYDKTVIVFTSDHGEEFDEHGMMGWHSHTLYDELLRVPLIIKLPESQYASYRVGSQVRGIDIAPTLLDILGIDKPKDFMGMSLIDNATSPDRKFAISELDANADYRPWSIRTPTWKLSGHILYDLGEDPGEKKKLHYRDYRIGEELWEHAKRIITSKELSEQEKVQPDEETLESLRQLGYIE